MTKQSKQIDKLIATFLKMDTNEKMVNFLEGTLTPKELIELTKRLQIVEMLKKGISQHQIAKKLGVGIATVTRGSKELQKGRFKYI